MTYRRAKLIWQVKHLKGLTFVSIRGQSGQRTSATKIDAQIDLGPVMGMGNKKKGGLTGKDMAF